jgi:hypothetical protein
MIALAFLEFEHFSVILGAKHFNQRYIRKFRLYNFWGVG